MYLLQKQKVKILKLRVFKIIKKTKVEGPNLRYCIWVQGCSKHCEGCYATNTWDKKGGKIIDTKDIIEDIKAQKGLEGITFLGGEPFEQASALASIARQVKNSQLSVVTFTGQLYENLKKSSNKGVQRLLKYTDLLIDGGFEKENFDLSRPWVGSKNQRYIFLSDFYNENIISKFKNKIEVRINEKGEVSLNGMGDFKNIEKELIKNKLFKKIK